jgi:hypothetical protein
LPENTVLHHIYGKISHGEKTQPPDIIPLVKMSQIGNCQKTQSYIIFMKKIPHRDRKHRHHSHGKIGPNLLKTQPYIIPMTKIPRRDRKPIIPMVKLARALHHIHSEGGDGAGDYYEVHAVPHLPEEGPRVQHQPVQDDLNKLIKIIIVMPLSKS